MVKVGAIDCRVEEELCEEFGVNNIPQLMLFNADYGDSGEQFTGKKTTGNIANAAGRKM
jgi:hypothetical protein